MEAKTSDIIWLLLYLAKAAKLFHDEKKLLSLNRKSQSPTSMITMMTAKRERGRESKAR